MLYRIYTENVNRKGIEIMCSEMFDGFTIIEADGYWKGQPEKCLIIEIAAPCKIVVTMLAENIKIANNQESVLIVEIESKNEFI